MTIKATVNMVHLLFDAGQHLLILAMLLSVSFIETGEEPHDRPANQRDNDRNPHRFHESLVFESDVDFLFRQLAVLIEGSG